MTNKEKIVLLWYKRDLRARDHAPLSQALKLGVALGFPVLALYSFEPSVTSAPDFSDFHKQFIVDSLSDLKISLKAI